MALTLEEVALLEEHHKLFDAQLSSDTKLRRYFQGSQVIEQLGMAVPPAYRKFLTIINWCGVQVKTLEARSDLRGMILPGQSTVDPRLQQIIDANNLDADLSMFMTDRYVYGRSFFSVGSNEENKDLPLIHVESPRQMTVRVDARLRRLKSAVKFYGVDANRAGPTDATLMLPDSTVWVQKNPSTGRWVDVSRDEHKLGRVPIVMSLCDRESGTWSGRSVMTDLMGITDDAARALTNLLFASEATAIPQKWAVGLSDDDFTGPDGKPVPKWLTYYNAIWASGDASVKFGQFTASDLKNFDTQLTLYGKMAASATGLPSRYFGLTTTNPPSADAIRAEEAQMVTYIQRQNAQVGTVLGWTAALALRFADGAWLDGTRIGVEWQDPATPTIAQREDALSKRRAAGVLSREGYWDELGWSEARKAKEREYLAAEGDTDPELALARSLTSGV